MHEGLTYINAYFTDDKRSSVRSYWSDQKDDLVEFNTECNESDPQWLKLLEFVTMDEIHENTWQYIKDSQEAFKEEIIKIARENGWIYDMDGGANSDLHKALVKMLFGGYDKEKQRELLFFLKLEIFEQDFIKRCTDKDIKKDLRRAEDIITTLKFAIEIYEKMNAKDWTEAPGSTD